MGFDISYHPIRKDEIDKWYFDMLEDETALDRLTEKHGMDGIYVKKYRDTLAVGRQANHADYFDKTHGFYIAVMQGFFQTYYYTRGSAFSFLLDEHPEFERYTQSWQELAGDRVKGPVHNRITENYSSGVYIPADQVVKLLADYRQDSVVSDRLNAFYTHNLVVFLKALERAKELGAGLLEATEVVEPNPFDLNKSVSYSNLFHCDTEGALLYREFALTQIREFEQREKLPPGEIADQAKYTKTEITPANKTKAGKGFWKRLFEK
jgi:hypothetical protein